ncbi:MAG: hypothetical protein GY803_32140, partial [Chloroflexi bacterium]|nr:hypothetical protein [Chloroflexota bacterium]
GLPPAQYELELALFDSDGAQMPVLAGDGAFQGVVYPAADLVTSSLIGGDLDIPVTAEPGASVAVWLDGGLTLLGHSVVPEAIINGGTAVIDLYWQANAALPGGVALTLSLGDEVVLSAPLSRYDSGQWRPGERIHEKVSMSVPPQMAAGTYPLQLHLFDEAGAPLAETAVPMGRLEIIATDRLFTLPDAIQIPLDYRFGDDIRLRGLDWPDETIVAVGDTVQLTLYWQTEARPETKSETQLADLVSAFVHLVGPDDGNIAQDDRWPGGLPSDTWAEGQIIVDEYVVPLPPDAPPGVYRVAVGLYTAANGLRLPATDGDGTAVPDNRVILPIALTVETAP